MAAYTVEVSYLYLMTEEVQLPEERVPATKDEIPEIV
jgi:hypothetical protein